MEPTTTAAIIGGGAAVLAAIIGIAKAGGSFRQAKVKNVSGSNIAIGDHITQDHHGDVHNYVHFAAVSGPEGKVHSSPSYGDIVATIDAAKPFDKVSIGQNTMWG